MKKIIQITIAAVFLTQSIFVIPATAGIHNGTLRPRATKLSEWHASAKRIEAIRQMIVFIAEKPARIKGVFHALPYYYTEKDIADAIFAYPGIRKSDLETLAEDSDATVKSYAEAALSAFDDTPNLEDTALTDNSILEALVLEQPDEKLEDSEFLGEVFAIADLTRREKNILILTIGHDEKPKPIAKYYHLTATRVGQIRDKTLLKLQRVAKFLMKGKRIVYTQKDLEDLIKTYLTKSPVINENRAKTILLEVPVSAEEIEQYHIRRYSVQKIAKASKFIKTSLRDIPEKFKEHTASILEEALIGKKPITNRLKRDILAKVRSTQPSKNNIVKLQYDAIVANLKEEIKIALNDIRQNPEYFHGSSVREKLVNEFKYHLAMSIEILRKVMIEEGYGDSASSVLYASYGEDKGFLRNIMKEWMGEDICRSIHTVFKSQNMRLFHTIKYYAENGIPKQIMPSMRQFKIETAFNTAA